MDDGSNLHTGRVCANCQATKTPLWRSGPSGAKNLCNACGIRFKKAGRLPAVFQARELALSSWHKKPSQPSSPIKRKSPTSHTSPGFSQRQRFSTGSTVSLSRVKWLPATADGTSSGTHSSDDNTNSANDSPSRSPSRTSTTHLTASTLKCKWKAFAKVYPSESMAVFKAMNDSRTLNTAIMVLFGDEESLK